MLSNHHEMYKLQQISHEISCSIHNRNRPGTPLGLDTQDPLRKHYKETKNNIDKKPYLRLDPTAGLETTKRMIIQSQKALKHTLSVGDKNSVNSCFDILMGRNWQRGVMTTFTLNSAIFDKENGVVGAWAGFYAAGVSELAGSIDWDLECAMIGVYD